MKMHCFLIPILKVQILGKCNRSQDPVSSSDIKKKFKRLKLHTRNFISLMRIK